MSDSASKRDLGWNYGTLPDAQNRSNVQCIFCQKITRGGITRLKQHLVGGYRNTNRCIKCPEHVKEELREFMKKKKEMKGIIVSTPHFDDVAEEEANVEMEERSTGKRVEPSSVLASLNRKRARENGSIDAYLTSTSDEKVKQTSKENQEQLDATRKAQRDNAVKKFARWMYDGAIPLDAVRIDSFAPALEAIAQFGRDMKPPTYHEITVTCLNKELERINRLLKSHEEEQAKSGCTLMVDGWEDANSRYLINFLVNTRRGTRFIESVDASSFRQSGDKLFELLDKYVQRIGEKDVVQVITDSGNEYKLAGQLLEVKYPHLFWSPCTAHCLDMIIEDILKIPKLNKTWRKAVEVNGYIYNRDPLLRMLQDFTGGRELVMAGTTRFVTTFLALKRYLTLEAHLRKLFTSEKWATCSYAKDGQGKRCASYILQPSFWNNVVFIVNALGPIVEVLRLVDGENKAPMGFIYKAMERAKEAIVSSFSNNKERYERVLKIIDDRWSIQLQRPLHAAGHFLNPEFFYANPEIGSDEKVVGGLYKSVEKLARSTEEQDKIYMEIEKYKSASGIFGFPSAVRQRSKLSPAAWWSSFGASAPTLQKFAIKVLSLTCSSSGCERNWSIFQHVHSKKRNSLEQQRLNDLVYVKYNRALMRRYDSRDQIDPIASDEIDGSNEWMLGTLANNDDNENVDDLDDDDDDDVTWTDVARASEVYVLANCFRSTSKATKGTSKASAKSRDTKLVDEDESNDRDVDIYPYNSDGSLAVDDEDYNDDDDDGDMDEEDELELEDSDSES